MALDTANGERLSNKFATDSDGRLLTVLDDSVSAVASAVRIVDTDNPSLGVNVINGALQVHLLESDTVVAIGDTNGNAIKPEPGSGLLPVTFNPAGEAYYTDLTGNGSSDGTLLADDSASVQVLPNNLNRTGFFLYNDSDGTAYVRFGSTATTTDWHFKLGPDQMYEAPQPCYQLDVNVIWSTGASGCMRVAEFYTEAD